MRHRIRLAALVLAVGLSSDAHAVLDASTVGTLATKWTSGGGGVTGGAVVRDGRVYVGRWNGTIQALDPTTGNPIWTRTVGGAVPGSVLALDDGGVCYGTFTGEAGCLDGATGAVRWTRDLTPPAPAAVWSAPVASNGRLFVGVAGLTDMPCSRGRLVALDLATGEDAWPQPLYTVPEKVCETDTAVACTSDVDCPKGGACVLGQGAGVTGSPIVDPTGEFVYMNTVGCYTFPSIGDSDAMFKVRASDGSVVWKKRVSAPEQLGACVQDTGIDCGVDADCPGGAPGSCQKKAVYHDFGFLNGPLWIEVPDGLGGTKVLIVSGSKNGTLYAFDEATGDVAWKNVVRIEPITPGFAGFGLFNGAIAHADGRIFAALYYLSPARVCSNDARKGCTSDGDCVGGVCPEEPKHLMAFDATTGATVWAEEIGRSWSHVAVANGVVYAGTQATDATTNGSWLYAHAADTGQRLATIPVPAPSVATPAVVGDTVYVGYGVASGQASGLLALSLCGNGALDAGEACDPQAAPASSCCTASCAVVPAGEPCDDGDACTSGDVCAAATCGGVVATADGLACALARLTDAPCGDEALPSGLAKAIRRAVERVRRLVKKATSLAARGKTAKAERVRTAAGKALDGVTARARRAAAAAKASKKITAECRDALSARVSAEHGVLAAYPLQ